MTGGPHPLEEAFQRAQTDLIAGLNGIGRTVGTDVELSELRRRLIACKADCEKAGIQVETLWEFALRTQSENESALRIYATEQAAITPVVKRSTRQFLAGIAGVSIGGVCWTYWGNIWLSLIAGLFAFATVDVGLFELFPTPGTRVGRRAFSLNVGILPIWQSKDPNQKDYETSLQMSVYRARYKPGRAWIKVR